MNIRTSSFTVAITRCNIPYTDDIYRVIASSYSNNTRPVARRYIPGGYIPFSNQFSLNYFPPGLSNDATYVNLSNLTPDTTYYYTTDLKNKVEANFTQIYNGLLASNFIRTSLPIGPPLPTSNTVFNDISNPPGNFYPQYGIPVPGITYFNNRDPNVDVSGNQFKILNKNLINTVDFKLSDILPIHTSNNTGSTSLNAVTLTVAYSSNTGAQIQDITYPLRGYPITSCNYSIQSNYTKLSISSISDFYEGSSNFTGFYAKFSTIVSLKGDALQANPFPKQIIFKRISSDYTYSNSTSNIYIDDISGPPTYDLDLPSFYALSNNMTYICGIPCMNPIIRGEPLQITNLYRNFITPILMGNTIEYNLYDLDNDTTIPIVDSSYMTTQNLVLHNMDGSLINISNTYPLPRDVKVVDFTTTLYPTLFSPFLEDYDGRRDMLINFFVRNITSLVNNNNYLGERYSPISMRKPLYWDNPSMFVLNNTSCNTGPYGQRMINSNANLNLVQNGGEPFASYGPVHIEPSDQSGITKEEIKILVLGVPFDNTQILVRPFPRCNVYYPYDNELQLSYGYFMAPRYALSFSNTIYEPNGPPIGYLNYSNSYGFYDENTKSYIYPYIYPDYSTETINPSPAFDVVGSSTWRWATFSYFFPANTVNTRSGSFMIQILGNNFQMNPKTQKLYTVSRENDIQIYYKTCCPSEPLTGSNFYFNTGWLDAQNMVNYGIANFGFTKPNVYNGGLYPVSFTKSDTQYSNTTQNRIVAIPPFVSTQDFYLLITLGFSYQSQGAFQYIQPIFQ